MMKTHGPALSRGRRIDRRRRRGAVVVLMAFIIVILFLLAAMSIDVAHMQLTRSELRRATDAAARAGGEALSRTDDVELARTAAKAAARENVVAGQPLVLDDHQIVFGNAALGDDGRWHFTSNGEPYNSVQVLGSRTKESSAGEVSLFLGGLMGRTSFAPEIQTTVAKGDFVKRDFAVVVDRSGSMNSHSGHPGLSRWEALRAALGGFFQALNDTRDEELVGLASYSNSSSVDQWLAHDYSNTMSRLHQVRPGGMTNIYSGIMDGRRILNDGRARSDAKKIMVVMTDGWHNRGPQPIDAARLAAADGIEVYTITFGNSADIPRMRAVADATGGKHYHAPTAAELKHVFRQVVQESAGIRFVQ